MQIKLTSVIFVHKAFHWVLYSLWFQNTVIKYYNLTEEIVVQTTSIFILFQEPTNLICSYKPGWTFFMKFTEEIMLKEMQLFRYLHASPLLHKYYNQLLIPLKEWHNSYKTLHVCKHHGHTTSTHAVNHIDQCTAWLHSNQCITQFCNHFIVDRVKCIISRY